MARMHKIMKRKSYWIFFVIAVFILHYFYDRVYQSVKKAAILEASKYNFVPFNAHPNDQGALEDTEPRTENTKYDDEPVRAHRRNGGEFKDFETGFMDYDTEDNEYDAINPFPFKPVLLPSDPCKDPNLYIFFFIYSAPRNHDDRQLIRETWGNRDLYEAKIGYLFFLGLEENSTKPPDEVIEENRIHDDIIVENYIDSYFNLSRKGMAGMRYAHEHCGHVRRIVRSDDDVLIDVFHLIQFFKSEDPDFDHEAFLCRPQPSFPLRDEGSKWYVSWEEWPEETYPPVCNGFIYVMSPDVCGKLFDIALNTRYFKFEDVFITGTLMQKANITKVNIGRFFDGKFPRFTRALHDTPKGQDFPYIFTLTHKNTSTEVKEVWDYIKYQYLF